MDYQYCVCVKLDSDDRVMAVMSTSPVCTALASIVCHQSSADRKLMMRQSVNGLTMMMVVTCPPDYELDQAGLDWTTDTPDARSANRHLTNINLLLHTYTVL